ncbi:hypothetical protein C9374_013516 [Naegleria lovaniensis]|uniref:alpha-1,6-mannosyl-glycoprotein 6-beta-N-acetylglucosaminyltransferase n=1 Tax=Naegleria lovaniensis TaxID=51637 RepID=A0AA88KQ13_NAELO|nr:uncharacterized protein C9374_013516 [Naegleria lovaniensis]KAG2392031.1 hypothetical protein C9374_013516 [Naegleria lovaniensis]
MIRNIGSPPPIHNNSNQSSSLPFFRSYIQKYFIGLLCVSIVVWILLGNMTTTTKSNNNTNRKNYDNTNDLDFISGDESYHVPEIHHQKAHTLIQNNGKIPTKPPISQKDSKSSNNINDNNRGMDNSKRPNTPNNTKQQQDNFCKCIANGGKVVSVFNDHLNTTAGNAKSGGPAGELVLFYGVLNGLQGIANNFGVGEEKSPLCHLSLDWSEASFQQSFKVVSEKIAKCSNEQQKSAGIDENSVFHLIFVEMYSFDRALAMRNNPSRCNTDRFCLHFRDHKCRYRLIDFWGTPPTQNHHKLNLKQYLTPYPNNYNQFIGYHQTPCFEESISAPIQQFDKNENRDLFDGRESSIDAMLREKIRNIDPKILRQLSTLLEDIKSEYSSEKESKFLDVLSQVQDELDLFTDTQPSSQHEKIEFLVWGKEPRYFTQSVKDLLSRLHATFSPNIVIHTTLKRMEQPILPFIVNHGIKGIEEWRSLLRSVHFVIGIGDPVVGPTAMDAISCGAIFLNPVYDQERVLNNLNGWFKLKSQHPYVQQYIGPPYSFQYQISSDEVPFDKYHEEYLPSNAFKQSTVEEVLLRIIHGNILDKVLDQRFRLKGFLLKEYSVDAIQQRLLREIFHEANALCDSFQTTEQQKKKNP